MATISSMVTITKDEYTVLPDVIELMVRQLPAIEGGLEEIDLFRENIIAADGTVILEDALFVRIRTGNYEYHCPIWH